MMQMVLPTSKQKGRENTMTHEMLTGSQVAALVRVQPFYKQLQAELRRNEGDIDPEHRKRGYSHFVDALPAMRVLRFLETAPEGVPENLAVAARVFSVWFEHDYDFLPEREHGFREYFNRHPLRFVCDRLAEVSSVATRDGEQQADAYLQLVQIVKTGGTLRWIAPEQLPTPVSYILTREHTTCGPVYFLRYVLERDDQGAILSTGDVDARLGYGDLGMALDHIHVLNRQSVQEAYQHLRQLVMLGSSIRVEELHVFSEHDRLLSFVVVGSDGERHDINVQASCIFEMPLEAVPGHPSVYALRVRDLEKQAGFALAEILSTRLSRRTDPMRSPSMQEHERSMQIQEGNRYDNT
ncbi:MAG: hypothetical protein ACRDIV_17670 [Ktedonobacteraceae bacterium]